jgi:beta-xylosidase
LQNGEDWFIHFQERQPYGRIVQLQPGEWKNDWPVFGIDTDGDGCGEPVSVHQKPTVSGVSTRQVPQTSDEFSSAKLGLQWQWQANPQPEWAYTSTMGFLRLNPLVMPADQNLWKAPNLLLQKMPADVFTATTRLTFYHHHDSETTGLVVMGRDYGYIALTREGDQLFLVQRVCHDAEQGTHERTIAKVSLSTNTIELRLGVIAGGICQFGYRTDDGTFIDFGEPFQAREGKWIGAKVGLFCQRTAHENDGGYVNYDWFRIEK